MGEVCCKRTCQYDSVSVCKTYTARHPEESARKPDQLANILPNWDLAALRKQLGDKNDGLVLQNNLFLFLEFL